MNMFRTPKHRKYDYIPQYYSPENEERKERLRKAEILAEDSIEGTKARIAHKLSTRSGNGRKYEPQRRKAVIQSNLRLVIVLACLIISVYFLVELYAPEILDFIE